MTSYRDRWRRWHDKPCENGHPSSNNGWIYSAYGHLLRMDLEDGISSERPFKQCYFECVEYIHPHKINRSPGKIDPPMSRDEIMGLVCLGLLFDEILEHQLWQYCNYQLFEVKSWWDLEWEKVIPALWRCRAKKYLFFGPEHAHRNAIWKEPYTWNVSFRLYPQDTWYILKKGKRKNPNILHTLYFYASSWLTIRSKSSSSKLILWMKLKDLRMEKSWLYKKLDIDAAVQDYFKPGHPFRNLSWK